MKNWVTGYVRIGNVCMESGTENRAEWDKKHAFTLYVLNYIGRCYGNTIYFSQRNN